MNPSKQIDVPPPPDFVPFALDDTNGSVPARFEKIAVQYPNKLAVQAADGSFTYSELNRAANRVAHALRPFCSAEQRTVALLFETGCQMIPALLGTMKAAQIYVALDPAHPETRLRQIVEEAGSTILLTDQAHIARAEQLGLFSQIINVTALDESTSDANLLLDIPPETLSRIIFTSGSTGRPKGVVHSHRSDIHQIYVHTNTLMIAPSDRIAMSTTYTFLSGISALLRALLNGGTALPFDLRKRSPAEFGRWLSDEKVSLYQSVPTVFRHLVAALEGGEDFSALRILHLGGEAVYPDDVEQFRACFPRECLLLHNLGSSEVTTFRQYFINHETIIEGHNLPVGYAVPDKEVILLGEDGTPVGSGEVGEMAVRSSYLSLGYWKQPELTTKCYHTDPDGNPERTFFTGDLGVMDDDGCLTHMGRKDFQVKINGLRIELGEIEAALLALKSVSEAVVTVRGVLPEQKLAAFVVLANGESTDASSLRQALAATLPSYMIPTIQLLEEMPLTINSKVDRGALAKIALETTPVEREIVPPATDMQRLLVELWGETLELDQVSIDDDFFSLGGNSLLATAMFNKLCRRLGRELDISILLQAATVAELAETLERQDEPMHQVLIPIQPQGDKPPFFCVTPPQGSIVGFAELAQNLGMDQPFYGMHLRGIRLKSADGTVDRPDLQPERVAAQYVDEIRQMQPHGPYFIGGRCYGAYVAYEMARLFVEQGEEVRLLAMLTARPKHFQRSKSHIAQRLAYHIRNGTMGDVLQESIPKKASKLRRKASWKRNKITQKVFANRAKGPIENAQLDNYQYAQQPYPGRITVFQTSVATRSAWEEIAIGGVDFHVVGGTHLNVFREPHVQALATKLKNVLESRQSGKETT